MHDPARSPEAPLAGLTALVTGCGRRTGIGRAIARSLALAGADVAITDVTPGGSRNVGESHEADAGWNGLPSVVAEIEALGRRAVGLVGDVGSSGDAERLVAETVEAFGRLDILVNNAAAPQGSDRGWTWNVPPAAFDHVMQVNAGGVFLMSSGFARHALSRQDTTGRIVNIASSAGLRGFPQRAAYCASKFATIGLTQVMALELAPHGITVNAVCPGGVETARHSARLARATDAPDSHAAPAHAPIPRMGTPDEIARAVVFLADPAAGYITGQSISVDGGVVMR